MAILKYKSKNGSYQALMNYAIRHLPVVQGTGDDPDVVMSQDAITKELAKKQDVGDYAVKSEVALKLDKATYETDKPTFALKSELVDFFDGAEYTDGTLEGTQGKKVIAFKHQGVVKVEIDAAPFIKDGMIDTVEIKDNKLVITWNSDSDKAEATEIPLTDIFNPENFVSKEELIREVTKVINNSISGTTTDNSNLRKAISDMIAKAIEEALSGSTGSNLKKEFGDAFNENVSGNTSIMNAVAKAHDHTNKNELDKIQDGDVAKWNSVATASGSISGTAGTSKTVTALSQTNGKVSATFADIAIASSQVSGLGAAAAKAVVTSVDTSASLPTSNAVKTFVEGKNYSTTTGTVTSVGMTVPTGLSVNPSTVTSAGTFAVTFASGYSIPTTAKQTAWDGKQDAISDLTTIRNQASSGATAFGWGDHSTAGYLKGSVRVVSVTSSLNNQTTSVAAGHQETVIYANNGTEHTVSISTSYKSPDGQQINLTIPANGYGEVNFLNVGGTIYARGV